jgi:hypothetical protein
MWIEAILEYLVAIGSPDRETWRLWLAILAVGILLCVVLAIFG